MTIHNLMEDLVTKTVNEIFDEEEQQPRHGYCTCPQCRLDVVCYVLNRVPPQYAVSGRGLAHILSDYQDQLQTTADLVALINKGIQTVSATRRPQFAHDGADAPHAPEGPVYNFPVVEGRLLSGVTFEPVSGVAVSLLSEGTKVEMIDGNWPNPYPVSDRAAGSFFFWPFPVAAEAAGLPRSFDFELAVAAPEYDEIHHFFKIELVADPSFAGQIHYQRAHKLTNLVLFPKGTDEEASG